MSRRTIPFLCAALLSIWAFPLQRECGAAPVPPAPKTDDTVSPSAIKLLEHRKVQKELKMSAEQRIVILDGLADIDEEYEKKIDELARMPNPTDEQFDKLDKDRMKAVEKLLTESATKSLTAAQRTRLRQFDWRFRGPTAFTDPTVAKALQLTADQNKKATEVAERLKGEVDRYLDGLGDEDDAKRKAALFTFRKERIKEMENALTADQKTAWAAMLGDAPTGFVVEELWLRIEEESDLFVPGIGK